MTVLAVITRHLVFPHMVDDGNVGWWERVFAIVLIGWSGVAAFCLERRLPRESPPRRLKPGRARRARGAAKLVIFAMSAPRMDEFSPFFSRRDISAHRFVRLRACLEAGATSHNCDRGRRRPSEGLRRRSAGS